MTENVDTVVSITRAPSYELLAAMAARQRYRDEIAALNPAPEDVAMLHKVGQITGDECAMLRGIVFDRCRDTH